MNVYRCPLYEVVSEELISLNLIELFETYVKKNSPFTLKSVPENTDPAKILNPVIGFYPPYGIPYISNSDSDAGTIGVDVKQKRLLYEKSRSPFFEVRDSIVFFGHEPFYVHDSYSQILQEFLTSGYKLYSFNNIQNPSESIFRHKDAKALVGERPLKLEEVLS